MYEIVYLLLVMAIWKLAAEKLGGVITYPDRPFMILLLTVTVVFLLKRLSVILAGSQIGEIADFLSKLISIPFVMQMALLFFFFSLAIIEKRILGYSLAVIICGLGVAVHLTQAISAGVADAIPHPREITVGNTFVSGVIGIFALCGKKPIFWLHFLISFTLLLCSVILWAFAHQGLEVGPNILENTELTTFTLLSFGLILCLPTALVLAMKKSKAFQEAIVPCENTSLKMTLTAIYDCISLSITLLSHTILALTIVLSIIYLFTTSYLAALSNAIIAALLFPITRTWIQDNIVQLIHSKSAETDNTHIFINDSIDEI